MGGVFILFATLANMALWCNWNTPETFLISLTLILFAAIGLLDDLNKAWHKKGISAGLKFRLQLLCALGVAVVWIWLKNPTLTIFAPIFKGVNIGLGSLAVPLIILWVIFIIVGTSNAVNLTDGLDGLAIGSLILNFSFFGVVAYFAGQADLATFLHIPFANCSELTIISAILTAASLGFFWFNRHPAQIFMGDVGSLSLGAVLAMMAIIARQELLLAISGGIFALEALSVIGQIFAIKTFGKKMISMAPLHHHFEVQGWPESKVTARFHTITLILCICAAIVLKIR
jgi:phospho-N-acetylmuramoyl-pentapeptide-transferase